MKLTEIWTRELLNGIFGGLTPVSDPFDNTTFYISDGWGSAYPSMKLRHLSFENGKELHAVSIKNSVRSLYFNPDERNMFATSDNKIFHIDRKEFSIINKFDKGIQKFSDFIASNDTDTLLLMNRSSDFLFVYNYINGKTTKKKLKTCGGFFKEDENTYLIFCPQSGSVQQYDLKTNTLRKILQTEVFYKSYISKSNKLYFHLGTIIEATSDTSERIDPINKIVIHLKNDLTKKTEIKFEFSFQKFIVSENEEKLYLIHDNQMYIYSMSENKVIDDIALTEKARIAQVFDKQQVLLSYAYDKPNTITCWKF